MRLSYDVRRVKCVCAQLLSCLRLCNLMDSSPLGSSVHGISPGKNTGVGCYALLQGIFPTQGSNPGLLCLLYGQAGSTTSATCSVYHGFISPSGCNPTVNVNWSDQSLSRVRLFVTPWIAARQASLSITNSRTSLRLTSIESVMPSSHLILGRPLLLLPPIPPSIRVFSNESTLCMRWPKNWSFRFSIIPSKEIPGLIPSEWTGWISLQS